MSGWIRRNDPWALGAFGLWVVIVAMGFFPELTYGTLRQYAGVVTQNAWVNSPFVITIIFSAYVGFFTWRRGLECKAAPEMAEANAVQIAFMSFLAFAPVNPVDFQRALQMGDLSLIAVIWGTGLVKLLSAGYIISLFFRYYLLHNYQVFASLGSFFPSARRRNSGRYKKSDSVYDPTGE